MRAMLIAADQIPVSVENLLWTVSDYYNIPIEIIELPEIPEIKTARSLLARLEDPPRAAILLVPDNLDHERFAAIKELSHIIIDEREDWSTDVPQTINDILHHVEFSIAVNSEGADECDAPRASLQSEALATLVCIELLYPFELRIQDAEDLRDGKASISSLAEYYRLPQAIVERALHTDNLSRAGAAWIDVGVLTKPLL